MALFGLGALVARPLAPAAAATIQSLIDAAPAGGTVSIPAGTYQLHRSMFYKHGYEAFEVTSVPARERILIHIANTEADVEGCIGLGLRFGKLLVAGVPSDAVVESRAAFARFMAALAGEDTATLSITWAPGLPAS